MLFFTLDHVYAVEAPSIGDCCFTNQEPFPDVFVGWSLFFLFLFFFFFLGAPNYKPGADREKKKTQMLGLELSGLIGEHVVHFHFESFLIVCLPKRPEENVQGEVQGRLVHNIDM